MSPSASLDLQSLSLTDRKHVLLVSAPFGGHLLPIIQLGVQLIRLHACRISLPLSKVAAGSAACRHLLPSQWHYNKVARVIRTLNNLQGEKAPQRDLEVCPLPHQRVDHIFPELFPALSIEHAHDLGLPIMTLMLSSASAVLDPTCDDTDIGAGAPPAGLAEFFKVIPNLAFSCARVGINTEPITSALATASSDTAGKEVPARTPIAQYTRSWLDKQHTASGPVVVQMAEALDKLKNRVSFLWWMRAAQQAQHPANAAAKFDIFNDPAAHVPRDATALVMGWAPQIDILSHPATKAFLTHCGWNSATEPISTSIGVVVPGTSLVGGRVVPDDEIVDAVNQVFGTDGKETVYRKNGG
ncbi:hypothetical protein RI367_001913 [Sorochytrium milnesiophthora]